MFFFTLSDTDNRRKEQESKVTERYYNEILSYCRYHLSFDKEASEECTQDVFVTFLQTCRSKNIYTPRAWLYRTADNFINRYKRYLKKQKKLFLTLPYADGRKENLTQQLIYNQNFERIFYEKIDLEKYKNEILKGIKKDELELINLYFKNHVPIKKIAAIYNISENAVSNRLHRLRLKIKKKIEKIDFLGNKAVQN